MRPTLNNLIFQLKISRLYNYEVFRITAVYVRTKVSKFTSGKTKDLLTLLLCIDAQNKGVGRGGTSRNPLTIVYRCTKGEGDEGGVPHVTPLLLCIDAQRVRGMKEGVPHVTPLLLCIDVWSA